MSVRHISSGLQRTLRSLTTTVPKVILQRVEEMCSVVTLGLVKFLVNVYYKVFLSACVWN
jgi:hypothetical protein